jgi:hypothetical protein
MMDLVTLILACSLYTNNAIPYAMIQADSKINPLLVSVNNDSKHFTTATEAISYTQQQIAQGQTVNIGLMQISSQWLPEIGAHAADLFRPCKNIVVATQIMNKLRLQCQTLAERNPTVNIQTCMLSLYKTGNPQNGLAYANTVINYATKHPFAPLAEKARDPGMMAAAAKPKRASSTKPLLTSKTKVSQTS